MRSRALALSLALLLLVTQQFGLRHLLGHAMAAPPLVAAAGQSAAPGATAGASGDLSADTLCQACLVLATLGVGALPALLGWRVMRGRQGAPACQAMVRRTAGPGAPYLARAPPAALALI